MKSSDHTGGFATPPGMATTADTPYTPATGVGPYKRSDEPCRADGRPDPSPGEYKRDRDGSKKRENKAKNRKAAKAARKARRK